MIRKFIRSQRQPWWYSLFAILISALLIAGTSLWQSKRAADYARAEARKSEQKWCEILVTITNSQKNTPPQNESGKRFASEIERLRVKFDC